MSISTLISLIFGILSVAVVAFGYIYIKIADNGGFSTKKRNKTKPDKSFDKKKKKTIKDIWDIEDIRDGVIYLNKGFFAAVVKLGSVDIRLLSENEQQVIEEILIRTAISIQNPFKFIILSDNVDATNTIADIHQNSIQADVPLKIKALAKETINFLDNLMKNKNIYERENYVVLTCRGDVEKAYGELQRACEMTITQMNSAKIKAERVTSSKELDFVFKILNSKSIKPSETAEKGAFELYVTGGLNNAKR